MESSAGRSSFLAKLRLAKCKIKSGFPKTEKFKWEELKTDQINNLSQVNKINLKKKNELEACYKQLLEEFETIE